MWIHASLFFYFSGQVVWHRGSPPNRNLTHTTCRAIMESWPLDHQRSPHTLLKYKYSLKAWKDTQHNAVNNLLWGLPWWSSGWESTFQCRGCGFDPWPRSSDHTTRRATKPMDHNYQAHTRWGSHTTNRGKATSHTTKKTPCALAETQKSQKQTNNFFFKFT